MSRSIVVIMAMGILLSGCAPVKTMVRVDEPDLAEVKTGIQRTAAEKVLGKRLWHVGVSDGLSYDIYQYEKEQPPEPMLGLLVLVADVISFGSLELENDPRNFGVADQVAVAYDNQNQVVFVSNPWPAQDLGPCRRQRYLIPKDVGVPANTHPDPQEGLSGTALTMAILEDDDQDIETIDGHVPEEDVIELLPGPHEVEQHGVRQTVEFFPGRRYRMEHESCYGCARSQFLFVFIEDVDSSETLLCLSPLFIHD